MAGVSVRAVHGPATHDLEDSSIDGPQGRPLARPPAPNYWRYTPGDNEGGVLILWEDFKRSMTRLD